MCSIREQLIEIYKINPKHYISIWYNDRVIVSGPVCMLIGCVGSVILDIKDYDFVITNLNQYKIKINRSLK